MATIATHAMPWRIARASLRSPSGRSPGTGRMALRLIALVALLALNWYLAALVPSALFSITSLLLFCGLLAMVARISATGLILLLPLVITRGATLLSLIFIEAGAYMPEVNRLGSAGDASASFVAFTAIFFLSFAAIFCRIEGPVTAYARSPMLDSAVRLLGWPVVIALGGWGAIAFLHGLQGGFPLMEGIDRFLYRREYSSNAVLMLLDQKFLVSAMLGAIAFGPRDRPLLRLAALLLAAALTALYFLFGDKFFTILTEVAFFVMPLLLQRRGQLKATVLRLAPPTVLLLAGSLAATVYIYSDYGRLPLDRTATLVGERMAGQGELWFVASRDARQFARWDSFLVARNIDVLDDKLPPASAFANGVETYYFIQRYAPAKLAASFRKNGGWVQLTMGSEAMALVMFGYLGTAVAMLVLGLFAALSAAYLRRAFASSFPLSLYCAVWFFVQVYLLAQQASLWGLAAPAQFRRLILFVVIEIVLLAFNRAQALRAERAGARTRPLGATPRSTMSPRHGRVR